MDAECGCVAAQIKDIDETTGAGLVNVKNPFSMDDKLELMMPDGMQPCEVEEMLDFRGAAADRLNPGTEGRVFLAKNTLKSEKTAKYGFLVNHSK